MTKTIPVHGAVRADTDDFGLHAFPLQLPRSQQRFRSGLFRRQNGQVAAVAGMGRVFAELFIMRGCMR